MLSEEQEQLLENYKSRFGTTFSYWAIAQDEAKLEQLFELIKSAITGNRGAVTDADLNIDSSQKDILI